MKYSAVVFDFFGVFMNDIFNVWSATALSPYKAHEIRRDLMPHVDTGGVSRTEFFSSLATDTERTPLDIEREWNALANVDAEVVNLVRGLKKRYKIGLCSNAASWELRPILENNDLVELFNTIVISGEVGTAKPNVMVFKRVLTELACDPTEVVFIDDNENYVTVAGQLGMYAIHYTNISQLTVALRQAGVTTP